TRVLFCHALYRTASPGVWHHYRWSGVFAAPWTKPIQLNGTLTIHLVCHRSPDCRRKREAVSRKPQRQCQPCRSRRGADERDIIDALRFQAAPGPSDALLADGRQQPAARGPVALDALRARAVPAPVGCCLARPAPADKIRAVLEL